jgi:excisionase family DNA binding protein
MSTTSTGLGKDERPVTRQTYSIDEVAKLLGIGRNAAYEGARRGDFPLIRIGARMLVPRLAIDRMLNPEAGA